MNLTDQVDTFLPIRFRVAPQYGERIQPHCRIMKILSVPVQCFTDTDTTRSPKYAVYLRYQPLGQMRLLRIHASFRCT